MEWIEGLISNRTLNWKGNYPCKIKNCDNKKRNGRCKEKEINRTIKYSYDKNKHYYKCKNFKLKLIGSD